jgi:hypothetical protein
MKVSNFLANFILLTGSLLFALLVGETAAYIYMGPKLTTEGKLYKELAQYHLGSRENPGEQSVLRENLQIVIKNFPTSTNNFGLREHSNRFLPKPENVLRIAIFGDSVTFGQGVLDNETLPYQIEKLLNDHFVEQCKVEVFNFGVSGFNSLQELIYFSKFGMKFSPDIVLFQWLINDYETNGYKLSDLDVIKQGQLLESDDISPRPKHDFNILTTSLEWVKNNSSLYEMAVPKIKHVLTKYFGIHADANAYYYTNLETEGARLSVAAILEAKNIAKKRNIQFGAIIYPIMSLLESDYYQEKIYGRMESIFRSNDVESINLFLEVFSGRDYQDLISSMRDHHPNSIAHELAAKSITNWLLDEDGLSIHCPITSKVPATP